MNLYDYIFDVNDFTIILCYLYDCTLIYNILLDSGKRFEIDVAEEFIPLGTPNDIKKTEA